MASPGNTITSDHRGPAVDITVWSFFIVSGLAVTTKVWTKLSRANASSAHSLSRLQLDDYTVILSLAFTAAFSIALSQQVVVGLGAPIEKLAYIAQLCYICATCLTNSAGTLFGLMLQPSPNHVRILKATLLTTSLWFLSSIFAVAFQCRVPHVWAIYTTKCVNQMALWTFFEVMDLLVNLASAVTLCSIIWILRTSHMKYLLVAFFASRALIFIPIGFKLAHLQNIRSSPHWNITPELASGAMISDAILNTNLFITSLPFLKPTMEYLMPGWSTSSTTTGFMRGGFGYSSTESRSKSSRSEKQ